MIGKAIGKLSDAERARFTAASRACTTHLEFEANTRLDPEERAAVLGVLASFARTKTAPIPAAVAEGRRSQSRDPSADLATGSRPTAPDPPRAAAPTSGR